METIKTEAPKHAPELLTAVERTLAAHDLRLQPGVSLEDVVEGLAANQVTVGQSHGYLTAEMSGAPVHISTVIESFANKAADKFFPRDVAGVAGRDQLDQAGKLKFIREQGISAWEKLPQSAPTQKTVVLDKTRLTCSQYMSLDRSTRATLSGQWGADTIARILSRKK